MKAKGLIFAQTLLAAALLHATAEGQSRRLVFNLTDPSEAERWTTEAHDPSQGPVGFHQGLYRLASGPDAPAFMEREVDFHSSEFNRMTVDMRVVDPGNAAGGLVGSAVFLFDEDGMVIPESRILTNTPVGVRTSVVIRLDQSVFWTGHVNRIRFDPVWGVGRADIASITLDLEPPPEPAPRYYFTNRETTAGWMIGEFDEQSSLFVARPTNIDGNGMAFSNTGPAPVLQNLQTNLNADLITSAEMVLRTAQPVSTQARFFWGTADNPDVSNERAIVRPVQASTGWQTLNFDLASHPGWTGQVTTLIINPTLVPGSTQIRSLRFEGIEGLGERGEEDALVTWRTHSEVGRELTSGNYKPLLVLVTMDGNPFSTSIELDLAGNQRFLEKARDFHAVRMQYDDPATTRVFSDIYRIPVLATMTWDFDQRQWEIRERLIGPDVATDSIAIMERTLAR